MPEPRTAVMISVEASWEDQSGNVQTVPARMENKSPGGACIRLKKQIVVGAKLNIKWRWDQFVGVAKYCRSDGREYLVGIQREKVKPPVSESGERTGIPFQVVVRSSSPLVSTAKIQIPPRQELLEEMKASEVLVTRPKAELWTEPRAELRAEPLPVMRVASFEAAAPPKALEHPALAIRKRAVSPIREFETPGIPEFETRQSHKKKAKGAKDMQLKWLDLTYWHNKPDAPTAKDNGSGAAKAETPNRVALAVPAVEKISEYQAREKVDSFQVELLPVEEIYRAAGIMNPRRGYSIHKVVEMLHSEHIRGLSKEMKRAAVLMALDAAGIPLETMLQDAKARQDALKSYDAEQRKQVEAELARKMEENVQIQAELERVKQHYMARISRNLDGVARVKSTYSNWLASKDKESQSMTEAVEMCLKPSPPEPAKVPPPAAAILEDAGLKSV